jgi:hypothetical protein
MPHAPRREFPAVGVPALGERHEPPLHIGHADGVEIAPGAEVRDRAHEEGLGTFNPAVSGLPALGLLFEMVLRKSAYQPRPGR